MSEQELRFRGITVSKKSFEEKYSIELSNYEWKRLVENSEMSWNEQSDELRLLIFKHVRRSMESMGYKVQLKNDGVVFVES